MVALLLSFKGTEMSLREKKAIDYDCVSMHCLTELVQAFYQAHGKVLLKFHM